MRILHVIPSIDISSGGPSKSVCDLALCQAIKGEEVTILTNSSLNPFFSKSNHSNFRLFFSSPKTFKLDLKNLIISGNFEILHGHGLWDMPVHYMAQIGRENKIPYLITPRGTLHPWALNFKKWKKKVAMFFYQKNDLNKAFCLHATSEKEAEYFRDFGIKIPISVIPNGIELSDFSVLKSKKDNEKNILLFLSRVHEQKGLSFLIDAWQRIDNSLRDNWCLEIAGNGDEKYIDSLKKNIYNKGLSNEIKIIGPQFGINKLAAFHRADLFVLPSFSENFGIVIAEALACGLPVITTVGTPWQELNSSQAGWWINIGIIPLQKALIDAMNMSNSDRLEMGLNGRNLIKDKYSIHTVASQTIDLYQWILGKVEKPIFVNLISE